MYNLMVNSLAECYLMITSEVSMIHVNNWHSSLYIWEFEMVSRSGRFGVGQVRQMMMMSRFKLGCIMRGSNHCKSNGWKLPWEPRPGRGSGNIRHNSAPYQGRTCPHTQWEIIFTGFISELIDQSCYKILYIIKVVNSITCIVSRIYLNEAKQ